MKHRGISFWVTEMEFPGSWEWAVCNGRTVSVGVCSTREEAILQANSSTLSSIGRRIVESRWQTQARK
jgi:hypothetical protein